MANYTLVYPPAHNTTYVKATTKLADGHAEPHFATDPAKSLTGTYVDNCWQTVGGGVITNQRFHIDLGSAKMVRRIYYQNYHHEGGYTTRGAENITFWGSNTAAAFADLTYATDTNWTQLGVSQSTFDIHATADAADPKYILVGNNKTYRYYALKIADNYGDGSYLGIRRISLMTQDGYVPPKGGFLIFMT